MISRSLHTLTLVLLLGAGSAAADGRDAAREAFREGALQYDLGDYKAALVAFKRAYLAFEDPVILYNIAQCQRHLGDKSEAARTYRVFLKKVPGTHQRAQVEKLIAELEAAIEQDKAAATRAPTETLPPSQGAPVASPAPAVIVTTAAPAEKKKPKKWVWGVVAGGVVVVAAAVALGVVFGGHQSHYLELTY